MPRESKIKKILVVEDNPGDFLLIQDFIADEYPSVLVENVATLKNAKFRIGEEKDWSAILLDLTLPDGRGSELISELLSCADDVPVIVLTGYSDKEFGISSLKLGIADYLLKDELTASLLSKSIEYSIERKHIDNELKNSERKYRELFQSSPLPMWVYDMESFNFLSVNEAAIKHYGYSEEEFLSMNIKDIRPKEDFVILQKAIAQSKKTGAFNSGTFRHLKKNGDIIFVEVQSNSIEFEGKPARLILTTDISDKLNKEEQILKSNERLKTASEIAKLGYWEFNLQNDELYWTDEVFRICGVRKESFDVNLQSYQALIHPDDLDEFKVKRNKSFKSGIPFNTEHRIVCPDGTVKYVYENAMRIDDAGGKATRFEGIIQDVTRKKEEEHHLKLLESVITHATDAVVITLAPSTDEPQPKIVYVNEAFSKMSGYSREEVLGKAPRFLQGPKTNKEELIKLEESLQNWQTCEVEILNYKKTGEEFWINLSVAPVADSKGNLTHWISIERDITERINYIKAIEDQNANLRTIGWTQSHLVRAPLASIMGLVNLLKDENAEDKNELLNYLMNSANELDELIRDIVNKTEIVNTKIR